MKTFFKNSYVKIFILGFVTCFCILLPFLIIDKGFFLYAGDFNSQQIPFNMYANNMVKQGALNWSWATDLGSSMINSYSFYLLGSPVFWLSCLLPYKLIPYFMPFGLMIKFGFASLGAFCFLKRYAKNENYAFVGAILYAFSGFSIYNIFFNHFLESVAMFPFLLWSLDEFVYEKRRGPFAFFVALNLLNNYFFFVGQVVFLFIYFICKIISKEYNITIKEFFVLSFESLVGCFMAMVLLLPSILNIIQNPRSTQIAKNFGLWMYSTVQQYFAIIQSAFLPPESPYSPNMFTNGSVKWTSMSAFVVLGGLFGYFIFLKYFRKSAFTKIFTWCVICSLVPILNSSFYAFNSSYYARWFYMPILILCAMNMKSYELSKEKIYYGLKRVVVITCIFCVFALTPTTDKDGKFILGLQKELPLFWLYFLIAIFSLYLLFVIVQNFKNKPKYSQKLLMSALGLVMIFSIVHLSVVKLPQLKNDRNYIKQNYAPLDTFTLNDENTDYRLDAYQCYNNMGLFFNKPFIQFFNSTVTPSIMEFYPYVDVKRDVSSKPEFENYALRSLLSVKYVVMPTHEVEHFRENGYDNIYSPYSVSEPYQIFKNDYFIPMGFTYDNFVTEEQMNKVPEKNRSNVLLRAILCDESIVDKYKLSLDKIDDNNLFDYSFETYDFDVNERIKSSSYYFEQTKDGFISNIKLYEPNLVFYSVPYDEGFTAFVNGTESKIYKVNGGLSAVYAPVGDNEIVFTYHTPGLNIGIMLSLISLVIYIGYLIINSKKKGVK